MSIVHYDLSYLKCLWLILQYFISPVVTRIPGSFIIGKQMNIVFSGEFRHFSPCVPGSGAAAASRVELRTWAHEHGNPWGECGA